MNNRTFLRFPNFKFKALTLSYDDGLIYDKKLVEILDNYEIKGTFNLISRNLTNSDERFVKEKEVPSVYKNHEVAVHGERHLSLTEVDKAAATFDVLENRKHLEKITGNIVKGMAYANGAYNDDVVEILKACGISYARTTISTEDFFIPEDWLRMPTTCHHKNPKLLDIAERFLQIPSNYSYMWSNRPLLFYLWGHSYEFNDDNNWGLLEEFCKLMGKREDIFYATNGEIFDYVEAFDKLKFSVDGKIIYNPSDKDVYLYYFGKNVLVKKGETVKVEE